MKIGDTVCCIQDLSYIYKDKHKIVKSGHSLILKQIRGDKCVLERFNKIFYVDKDIVRLYPLDNTTKKQLKNKHYNIVVLDDNEFLLSTLKTVINIEDKKCNLEFISMPFTFLDTYDFINQKIDLLICDIKLGDNISGVDVVKRVKDKVNKILIMSNHSDKEYIEQFINLGVQGYILKDDLQHINQVINIVLDGGTYFPQEILQQLYSKN